MLFLLPRANAWLLSDIFRQLVTVITTLSVFALCVYSRRLPGLTPTFRVMAAWKNTVKESQDVLEAEQIPLLSSGLHFPIKVNASLDLYSGSMLLSEMSDVSNVCTLVAC